MKRKASNIVVALTLLVAVIVIAIKAWDSQLAPEIQVSDKSEEQTAQNAGEVALPEGAAGLVLSEFMCENDGAVRDEDGDYGKWVEVYNSTSAELSLNGYSLSDREDDATKFVFPAMNLQPGEYKVIFLSGKNRKSAGSELHTGFKVNSEETLYLFSGSNVVDSVSGTETAVNVSKIKVGTTWSETKYYSPGFANDENGYNSYKAQFDKRSESALRINEVQSANATCLSDEQGLYPDWIEIKNTGSNTVDLTGYGLSDDPAKPMQWCFPSVTLAPGEYIVVFCDKQNLFDTEIFHTNFSLSSGGETLCLYSGEGYLLDEVTVPELQKDTSYGRSPDGIGEFAVMSDPTPDMANNEESVKMLSAAFFAEHNRGIYISELMTSNKEALKIGEESPDWVEITNRGGETVSLLNYSLTNKATATAKYIFPDVTLAPGESTILYLTGGDKDLGEEYAAASVDFKASSAGEKLYLYDANRICVDKVSVPSLISDVSYGRDESCTGFFYYAESTPGEPNRTQEYLGICAEPVFSERGGIKLSDVNVSLTAQDGATIYYTTDCSTPTTGSSVWTGEMFLSKNTVIRAIAVKDGYLTSYTATHTYLPEASHTVRVVSLVTDDKYLFSDSMGMYANGPNYQEAFPHGSPGRGANFWMSWEYPVHIEVWENDGTELVEQDGSFKLNGQYSRAADQKSFAVYARSDYGDNDRFYAPLFSDRDYDSYKAFVLRSTGQDNNRARMRDAFITGLMKGEDVMYQETEVCVLYLNGEYWGQYNMRERVNKWSIAQWEGITDEDVIDNIDLLKGNGNSTARTLNGDYKEYQDLISYCKSHSLRDEDNLKYVTDRVDVQNYFDYQIQEIFWANSDNGNIKYYRVPGGKWKWILFDMDWAMNASTSLPVSWDTFTSVFNPNGTGVSDAFDTTLSVALLKNDDMKELFLQRLSYFMNNVYTEGKMLGAIEEMYETMKPEMAQHYEKWPSDGSVESWERNVDRLRSWVKERPKYVKQTCQAYFGLSDSKMEELFGE